MFINHEQKLMTEFAGAWEDLTRADNDPDVLLFEPQDVVG